MQLAQHLTAVHERHVEVNHDELGQRICTATAEVVEQLDAVARGGQPQVGPQLLQCALHEKQIVRVILGDQNAGMPRGRLSNHWDDAAGAAAR